MEAKTKDLWVFVETNEDGTAKNVGIELLRAVQFIWDGSIITFKLFELANMEPRANTIEKVEYMLSAAEEFGGPR